MENIIEQTNGLGAYHTLIIRILKHHKGYLKPSDIKEMCLLPQKDTNAALNKLIQCGYVKNIQDPTVAKVSTSYQSLPQMYAVDYESMRQ